MITSSDIADILYRDCSVFGLERVPDGDTITDPVTTECITFHSKSQMPDTYWKKSFIEVNFLVPDIREGERDSIILGKLERLAETNLDGVTGVFDNTRYRYSIASLGIEEDSALKCHYVNAKILFNVLNT